MSHDDITVTLRFSYTDEDHPMLKLARLLHGDDKKRREEFLCSVLDGLLEGANREGAFLRLERVKPPAAGASPETTRTASRSSNTTDVVGTVRAYKGTTNPRRSSDS